MGKRRIRTIRAIFVGVVLILCLAGCEKHSSSSDTIASVELIEDQSTIPIINQETPTSQVDREQSAVDSKTDQVDSAPEEAEQLKSGEFEDKDVRDLAEQKETRVIVPENSSEPAASGTVATVEATTAQEVLTKSVELSENLEPVSITITATGDCTLGMTQTHSYENSFDEVYDNNGGAGYFFENVRDIFEQDDMTIINLECSLTTSTDRQDKQWNLKGKPEYIDVLTCSSIEAVSMGNNHRLDYGESGFEETVKLLEDAKIVYAYDARVGIYETKGISIGIVSVNEHYDGELVEEFLQQGIAQLKEEEVDLILACCHWGIEGTGRLDDYQVELGYKCIDWGADLVIGNHPHVLQGVNQYKDKYIVYSLGNFCFGGNKNPKDKDTMIFQQTFTFTNGELITDDNIRIIPCSISSVKNKNNYKPTPVTGKEAERIIEKVNRYSKEFHIQFDKEGFLR